MKNKDLTGLRKEYCHEELRENSVLTDPIEQFRKWFGEALTSAVAEPNAMNICTVSESGRPSSRIVLLKAIEDNGLVFFTNYQSKKGKELETRPAAAITFFWSELERQIRIEGTVEKISREESIDYFHSRPRGSQLGAWVSKQSTKTTKNQLESELKEQESYWGDKEIDCPEYWGGYILKPDYFEFWQGRPSRLHDRITYVQVNNEWKIERLSP